MKRKILIIVTIEVLTDKDDFQIKRGLTKGIYRGLDTEPNYIASPKDVNINKIDIVPIH
jgi:hypothetical protein